MPLESALSTEVKQKLCSYQIGGTVIWWERLNSGRIRNLYTGSWIKLSEKGTPDYVVIVRNKQQNLALLFLELKRKEAKLKLRPEQVKFKNKYTGIKDVQYHVIDDISQFIKIISDLSYDQLQDIK